MKKYNLICQQRGRSMVEMLGYLALAGVITFGAVKLYQTLQKRVNRTTAESELSDLVQNAKLLFRGRGDYSNISVDYLVKAGAIKSNKSPIKNSEMTVRSENLGKSFTIVISGLKYSDCLYFTTLKYDWAIGVKANGFMDDANKYCYEMEQNELEFIVK